MFQNLNLTIEFVLDGKIFLQLKTRSTGADEAGRLKYFGANLESLSNVAAFFFQKVKGSIFSSA